MAFFKNDNGTVLHSTTTVMGPDLFLIADHHADYTYPVEGWTWYDSLPEALTGLGLTPRQVGVQALQQLAEQTQLSADDTAALLAQAR